MNTKIDGQIEEINNAIRAGSIDLAKQLISGVDNVEIFLQEDKSDRYDRSIAAVVAHSGNVELIESLQVKGVDFSPFVHHVVKGNKRESHVEAMKKLFQDCDLNPQEKEKLLNIAVEQRDPIAIILLFHSGKICFSDHSPTFKECIEKGLHWKERSDDWKIAVLLYALGCDYTQFEAKLINDFYTTCFSRSEAFYSQMQVFIGDIFLAASYHDLQDVLKKLLEAKVPDISAYAQTGRIQGLPQGSAFNSFYLQEAAAEEEIGREEKWRRSLPGKNIVPINYQRGEDGNTALHIAAKRDHLMTYRWLTERNADERISNVDEETPPEIFEQKQKARRLSVSYAAGQTFHNKSIGQQTVDRPKAKSIVSAVQKNNLAIVKVFITKINQATYYAIVDQIQEQCPDKLEKLNNYIKASLGTKLQLQLIEPKKLEL